MATKPEDERVSVGVREHQEVLPDRFRPEQDPGSTAQTHPLKVRPTPLADQQDERPSGPQVLGVHVDFARRRFEVDLDPYGRDRVEDQEPGEAREGDGHRAKYRHPT